jgi:hypothetical protein
MEGYSAMYIFEKDRHDVFRIFKVWMPNFGTPGFYRQGISHCYFKKREQKRALPVTDGICRPVHTLAYTQNMDQKEIDHWRKSFDESLLQCGKKLPAPVTDADKISWMHKTVPLITVTGMWDFYKAIGYDYKAQKYLPDSAFKKYEVQNGRI